MLTGTLPYFQGYWTDMFQKRVSGGVLQFSRGIPRLAMEMCAKLLDKDPKTRIGSNGGAEEIRQDTWPADIDWESLYSKQLKHPIDPATIVDIFDPYFIQKERIPQFIGLDISAGPSSQVEGAQSTTMPPWSFAEGVDQSRTKGNQYM